MPQYIFHLGNTPKLSLLELQFLTSDTKIQIFNTSLCSLELKNDSEAIRLANLTGGIVKVSSLIKTTKKDSIDDIHKELIEYLASIAVEDKVRFSIGVLGDEELLIDHSEIKKQLSMQYIKSSFKVPLEKQLSAASLVNEKKLFEILVVKKEKEVLFVKTIWVQQLSEWVHRDRNKPYYDRRKGMLPPKVARMLVNIAVEDSKEKKVIYDPFCGSGTILMEGLMIGCRVVGSDIDYSSVLGSQQNIDFLKKEYQLKHKSLVFTKDATGVKTEDLPVNIDAIVTEPYLGRQTPKQDQLDNIFKGLYKLYLGCFKTWMTLLKRKARIVIILPVVKTPKKTYSLEKLIDKIKDFGYTPLVKPVIYSRPQAIVQRQIYIFELNKE